MFQAQRGFEVVGFAVFMIGTAVLALIDARTMRIPNRLLYPVFWSGLMLLTCSAACSVSWSRLTIALASAATTAAVFLLLHRTSGLGRGDVRLSGLLGLFLGWFGPATVLTGLVLGTLFAGMFGAALLVAGRADRRKRLPYGPFLIFGSWLALLLAVA